MIKLSRLIIAITITIFCFIDIQAQQLSLDSVEVIWEEAPHNGFPLMIYFEGYYYVSFREGENHGASAGSVRIIRSEGDGEWESVLFIEDERGWDIREGHFSILPDGRLHLAYPAFNIDGPPHYLWTYMIISEDGTNWSEPARFPFQNIWTYEMAWYDTIGYVLGDYWGDARTYVLYSTIDGIDYSEVDSLIQDEDMYGANESDIIFDDDGHLWAAIRSGDNNLIIADADPPYTDWRIRRGDQNPGRGRAEMIRLPDGSIILGSRYFNNAALYYLDLDSVITDTALILPSGGDSGYPAMTLQDGKMQVVYYSTHVDTISRIYFAHVDYNIVGISDRPEFSLIPNYTHISSIYPNPFNSAITIEFQNAVKAQLNLTLYDILNRKVAVIQDKTFSPGNHKIVHYFQDISSGTYFVQIRSPLAVSNTVRIIYLK